MLDKKERLYRSTLCPNFCFKYFWSFSNLSLILSRPEAFSWIFLKFPLGVFWVGEVNLTLFISLSSGIG